MLVTGSRAIIRHIPEFRQPKDWDLVGAPEELARVIERLSALGNRCEPNDKGFKSWYQGAMVELLDSSRFEFWQKVTALFQDEPTMQDPVLGELIVPPIGFLLMTKQCGLIYNVVHWHKNLEDIYFLRNKVTAIPDHVAALIPDFLTITRNQYQASHQKSAEARGCHPSLELANPSLHHQLHEKLALGSAPLAQAPEGWASFPERPKEERQALMRQLFAEEAMVVATEHLLTQNVVVTPGVEAQATRWALRNLITGKLPEGWRYFGLNHYREIRELIPAGWSERVREELNRVQRLAEPAEAVGARAGAQFASNTSSPQQELDALEQLPEIGSLPPIPAARCK